MKIWSIQSFIMKTICVVYFIDTTFVVHYENFIGLASNDDEDEIIEAPSQPKNSRNLVPQKNIYTPSEIDWSAR